MKSNELVAETLQQRLDNFFKDFTSESRNFDPTKLKLMRYDMGWDQDDAAFTMLEVKQGCMAQVYIRSVTNFLRDEPFHIFTYTASHLKFSYVNIYEGINAFPMIGCWFRAMLKVIGHCCNEIETNLLL